MKQESASNEKAINAYIYYLVLFVVHVLYLSEMVA